MSTQIQINANRENAKLSTGPHTPEGKSNSSLNALRTGLTGRTVLLPSDDLAAYQAHVDRFISAHQPATDHERALVQSIADTEWRLLRIPTLEAGIYALGRIEFAAEFASEQDPAVRAALVEAKTFLTYNRQLNNLSIQERRLRNQLVDDLTEIRDLQEEREAQARADLTRAVTVYEETRRTGDDFDPAEFGFEFSMDEVEERLAYLQLVRKGHSHTLAAVLARRSKRAA
ncbi:MAG: hypothetical protein JO108_36855 [Acidobacteriaceae bacterium]|nr:hypothetical protein [Acidobacteriaceae bacterium]